MNIKPLIIIMALCALPGCRMQSAAQSARRADTLCLRSERHKPVILDVDMCTDVDDVCALRIATALDDAGVISLRGVAYSVRGGNNIEAMRGMLVYDGKRRVPIGRTAVPNGPETSPYWDILAAYNDGRGRVYDAVTLYRRILASSKRPVDIITTGYVSNLEALIKSGPDKYSPLSGEELVRRRCGQLYVVGGSYPEGRDNNFFFTENARHAIWYITRHWPAPILFFRNDIGGRLRCGGGLQREDTARRDIVTRSLWAFGTADGRNAWDPFAVWAAAYSCGPITRLGFKRVDVEIDPATGRNRFADSPTGRHFVITAPADADAYYNHTMDSLLIVKARLGK